MIDTNMIGLGNFLAAEAVPDFALCVLAVVKAGVVSYVYGAGTENGTRDVVVVAKIDSRVWIRCVQNAIEVNIRFALFSVPKFKAGTWI